MRSLEFEDEYGNIKIISRKKKGIVITTCIHCGVEVERARISSVLNSCCFNCKMKRIREQSKESYKLSNQ